MLRWRQRISLTCRIFRCDPCEGHQLADQEIPLYEEKCEVLAGVRGHIDMSESMQLLLRKKCRLFCEFDELSENYLLNQVIKTTVVPLLRHGSVVQVQESAQEADALLLRWMFCAICQFLGIRIRYQEKSAELPHVACNLPNDHRRTAADGSAGNIPRAKMDGHARHEPLV